MGRSIHILHLVLTVVQYALKTSPKTVSIFCRCNRVPCFDDPCGPNSDCESRDNSAVCTCRPGYEGNAYDKFRGCELEPCSQDPCGTNAECTSRGRSAICKCPVGYSGKRQPPSKMAIRHKTQAGGVQITDDRWVLTALR